MKKCNKCAIIKKLDCFSSDKYRKDGLYYICKECCKLNYILHKKEILIRNKKYRQNNKEKEKIRIKKWKIDNYEYVKQQSVEYSRQYRKTKENKNMTRKIKKQYKNEKMKNNIWFKLSEYLRNRINKAIKRKQKAGSAVRDLGCTIKEFKIYIEQQFQPGMSWENYGEWHLDHIIPLASFNLENREQFLKACHYMNYQPLWAKDNLCKGDRLDWRLNVDSR